MMALRPVLSDEGVLVGYPYLARIDKDEYRVVYPSYYLSKKGTELSFLQCNYITDSGESFSYDAIRELARIY